MLQHFRRILFFTGKGGVGKTSAACATAVQLADSGRRVLLVSTDPASNLDEVLGVELAPDVPREVPSVARLLALNIDPEAAARAYRERVVGPYRGVLPAAALTSIEEQLSGACTLEIAAFDQFARLLADEQSAEDYDHIVFDTAPTGHTLRLLELPAAWTGFFDENTTGNSCLGPLSGLETERQTYAEALRTLRDPTSTLVVLVTRAEPSAIHEADRAASELFALGIEKQTLLVNGVLDRAGSDPIARKMADRSRKLLLELPPRLAALERVAVPLLARAPVGIEGLRAMASGDAELAPARSERDSAPHRSGASFESLLDELESTGRGVILTMGKGGVGKTTVATRVAQELARRGHRVHLTTTDPAADAAGMGRIRSERVRVSHIDPHAVTERYTAQVLATAGAELDAAGRALLEEDLRSPCTEEVAVFQAFAHAVAEGESEFVVIDTAPTGHTLLLLDAAEAYHREVLRRPGTASEAVSQLLPRLRDPSFARILLVALPEATPVHEALSLQRDLARAGITPFAWVVNRALSGLELSHPVLRAHQAEEARFIDQVRSRSQRSVVLAWSPQAEGEELRARAGAMEAFS